MSYFEHVTFVVIFLVKAIIPASTSTMQSRSLVVDSAVEAGLIRGAMSGTGLRRAGFGRCYLPVGVGWWGASPSLTRSLLVAVAWASDGAEASGHRGGGTSPCQRGGRARPSLHGCVGGQVRQYLAGSSGISLELWSCDGSVPLGVHRPRRYPSGATVLAVLAMLYVW